MKKTFIACFLCLASVSIYAQVSFQTFASLDKMIEKAQKEKKLIFIQVESDECAQCNDVAMTGLNSRHIKEKYEVNFLSTI